MSSGDSVVSADESPAFSCHQSRLVQPRCFPFCLRCPCVAGDPPAAPPPAGAACASPCLHPPPVGAERLPSSSPVQTSRASGTNADPPTAGESERGDEVPGPPSRCRARKTLSPQRGPPPFVFCPDWAWLLAGWDPRGPAGSDGHRQGQQAVRAMLVTSLPAGGGGGIRAGYGNGREEPGGSPAPWGGGWPCPASFSRRDPGGSACTASVSVGLTPTHEASRNGSTW